MWGVRVTQAETRDVRTPRAQRCHVPRAVVLRRLQAQAEVCDGGLKLIPLVLIFRDVLPKNWRHNKALGMIGWFKF